MYRCCNLFLHGFILFFLSVPFVILAQKSDNYRDRFGVYGHFTLNFHSADFKQLPNVENCCPNFESGTGTAFSLGGLYEIPISNKFSLSLRAGYSEMGALLEATENKPVFDINRGQLIQKAVINHTINTTVNSIGLETLASYNPVGRLRFYSGIRFATINKIQYEQKEEIQQPGFVFVENMLRTRNEVQGIIENTNTFQSAIMLGSSMEFPLNKSKTFLLTPEVFFSFGITRLAESISWFANAFRAGLAFKYAFPLQEKLPVDINEKTTENKNIPSIVVEQTKENKVDKENPLRVSFIGVANNNAIVPADTIHYEEFRSTELKPLLHYVFFDENSSVLPNRYNLLTKTETQDFTIEKASRVEILQTYYEVLNIVAKRLQKYSDATLKLVGCISDNDSEKNNQRLAKQRAEFVKKYLTESWSIEPSRITIESKGLPQNPSQTNDNDQFAADEENRRVELYSDNPEILAPIIFDDTLQVLSPSLLKILVTNKSKSSAHIALCPTDILRNESACKELKTLNNKEKDTLVWKINESTEMISKFENISVLGSVVGTVNEQNLYKKIVVYKRKLIDKKGKGDKNIAIYRLILFDFDKSTLSPQNERIVEFVKKRIDKNSLIKIEGFTDYLGDEAYNRKLSTIRAQSVGKYIGVLQESAVGKGEQILCTNSLPEGRFYNRTVIITVESPTH